MGETIRYGPGSAILFLELADGRPPAGVRDRAVRFPAEITRLTGRPVIVDTSRASRIDNAGDPREDLDGDEVRLRRLTRP
jgi:hypothetical protein